MSPVVELTEAQKVVLLGPNDLPKVWPQLAPLVTKACEWSQGQFNAEAVVDGVLNGSYQLLAYVDGKDVVSIAVLTISQFPTGLRICEVLLASGEGMHDWQKFEGQVAAYAKQHGCAKFRMIGREGLQRMLKSWKRVAVVLEKDFEA